MIYGLRKHPFWGYIKDRKYDVVFRPLNNKNRSILFKGVIETAAKLMPFFSKKSNMLIGEGVCSQDKM